jgi:hypothetical protein
MSRVYRWVSVSAAAKEVAAMVMVFFALILCCCCDDDVVVAGLWVVVVGSLALPESRSRSPTTYLNRPFQKS